MSEVSKNELKYQNSVSFPNNNSGEISPADLRNFNVELIDSTVNQTQYTADSSSFDGRLDSIESLNIGPRLDSIEQTTASLEDSVNQLEVASSSFEDKFDYLQTQSGSWGQDTGSYATTGSNTFIGDQVITGSVTITSGSQKVFEILSGTTSVIKVDASQAASNKVLEVADSIYITGSSAPFLTLGNSVGSELQIGLTTGVTFPSASYYNYTQYSEDTSDTKLWIGSKANVGTQNFNVPTNSIGLFYGAPLVGTLTNQFYIDTTSNTWNLVGDLSSSNAITASGFQGDGTNLSNVAILNQQNTFTANQTISSPGGYGLTINGGGTFVQGGVESQGGYLISNTQYGQFKSQFNSANTGNIFTGFTIANESNANGGGLVVSSYGEESGVDSFSMYGGGNNSNGSGTIFTTNPSNGNITFYKDNHYFRGNVEVTGSTQVGTFTSSLQNGNIFVGDGSNKTSEFSIARLATTGSNTFNGDQVIQGSGTGPAIDVYAGPIRSQANVQSQGGMKVTDPNKTNGFNIFGNDDGTIGTKYGTYNINYDSSSLGDIFTGFTISGPNGTPAAGGLVFTNYGEEGVASWAMYGGGNNTGGSATIFSTRPDNGDVTFRKNNHIFRGNLGVQGYNLSVSGSFGPNYVPVPTSGTSTWFSYGGFTGNNSVVYPTAQIGLHDDVGSNLNHAFTITYANADYQYYSALKVGESDFGYFLGDGAGYDFSHIQLYDNGNNTTTTSIKSDSIINRGAVEVTGSVNGNVQGLSITSQTASLDFSTGNFFTLNLASGTDTHIVATNVNPGQTVNLKVVQDATTPGTISYPSSFKFPEVAPYSASVVTNSIDVVTFVTFDDTSSIYSAAVKRLV